MEDVAAQVASLRSRVEQAARARTGAEYARKQAEQQVESAAVALREEFGAETMEQGQALRADLDRQIAAERAKIEQALQ